MCVVFITQAEGMNDKLLSKVPTAITYTGRQPQEVVDEDRTVADYPIPIAAEDLTIVNINDVFER